MRIALCASNLSVPILEAVRDAGHVITDVWVPFPYDERFCGHAKRVAEDVRAQLHVGRVTRDELFRMESNGVELLLSAVYPHKIPTPPESTIMKANIHPSLLPEVRGRHPLSRILLHDMLRPFAGVTLHETTSEWDAGPIIIQEAVDLAKDENIMTLTFKVIAKAVEFTKSFLANAQVLWNNRKPAVGLGSYWGPVTPGERTISLASTIAEISRVLHACGGTTRFWCPVRGDTFTISRIDFIKQEHDFPVGSCIQEEPNYRVYALADGVAVIDS